MQKLILNLVKAFDIESNFLTSHFALLGYYMYELALIVNGIFQEIIIILFSVALLSDRTDLCLQCRRIRRLARSSNMDQVKNYC